MNVLFIVNGLTFAVGVLYLSQYVESNLINKLGSVMILFFALGNVVSSFIPTDVYLFWPSVLAQIDMVTVLFGLWIYVRTLTKINILLLV